MIYSHYNDAPWDSNRWPNFHPSEFASPDTGQLYWDEVFFDKLQALRSAIGKPIRINSAHRSYRHNIAVGGAVRSMHKKMAVDISLRGHNRFHILAAARAVGFTGFGYYSTWLHLDNGRKRFWFSGDYARNLWTPNSAEKKSIQKNGIGGSHGDS